MNTNRNAIRAGLFIVTTVALIIAVIIAIEGTGSLLEGSQEREVHFALTSNISGLREGDEVRIGGMRAGSIRKVEFREENQKQFISARISLPKKYVVRHDAKIGIETGITGSATLNFESLGAGSELAVGEPLIGMPSAFTQLTNTLKDVAPKVDALATAGRDVLTDFRSYLKPIVEKYYRVADRGAEMLTQMRDLIGDTKTDIRGTMANLNSATKDIKEKMPEILDKVTVALTDIKSAAASTKDLTASARAVISGNKGKLDGIIAGLKMTSDNLKATSTDVRRSPWRLLYKPEPDEMANLNLFDAARQFSDGASELNDAATTLRDNLNNPQLNKEQLQKLMDKLTKSFDNFNDVEQKLWTSVKE